jgi:hypothetical protein
VWHFFFVIFHPEQYPMSWTWLTGKMSVKSIKKYHARWYAEEIAQQESKRSKEHESAATTVSSDA